MDLPLIKSMNVLLYKDILVGRVRVDAVKRLDRNIFLGSGGMVRVLREEVFERGGER